MPKWAHTANTLHVAALASHVACCGAPLAINVLALAFGAGLLSTSAPWLDAAHGALHGREAVLLGFSGLLVGLGGVTQYVSWRVDCGADQCGHGSCAPKKPRGLAVFAIVCVLFLLNVGVYVWHQGGSVTA